MNYYLLIYIFLCIGIGLGGTAFLYQSGRTISAITFLVGSLLIFTFFGLRFFENSESKFAAKQWPPIINTCPDYLVYYGRPTQDGKTTPTCVDPIGVSTKPGALKKWTGVPSTDDDTFYFDLTFSEAPGIALLNAQCERSISKGVSWEGITDGETCYKYKTPTSAGTGGDPSVCPPGTTPAPTAPPATDALET